MHIGMNTNETLVVTDYFSPPFHSLGRENAEAALVPRGSDADLEMVPNNAGTNYVVYGWKVKDHLMGTKECSESRSVSALYLRPSPSDEL